eukprot:754824-Hanusia_phi.AAC.4
MKCHAQIHHKLMLPTAGKMLTQVRCVLGLKERKKTRHIGEAGDDCVGNDDHDHYGRRRRRSRRRRRKRRSDKRFGLSSLRDV